MNFTDAIANSGRTGDYYFTVKGKWSGGYTDEQESDSLTVDGNRMALIQGRVNADNNASSGNSSSTGWIWNNGVWQYKRTNGSLAVNCWEQVKGKWYCFDASGNMRSNQWVRNTNNEHLWYYVGSDGAMVTNTSVNGYTINANGECWC